MSGESSGPRRWFLSRGGAVGGTLLVAGCLSDSDDEGQTDDADDDGSADDDDEMDDLLAFPEVEDPPAAVYRPTHREEMLMLEPVEAGEYRFGPMLTYPHPFWIPEGQGFERVDVESGEDVHLMVTAWDAETGIVIPLDTSPLFEIEHEDGSFSDEERPWLMISQQMGFHFGDNIALEDDGTYRVEGSMQPVDIRKTGAFEGRLEDPVDFSFEFELGQELRELPAQIEYFPEEEWGEPGALEPMDHGDHAGDEHDDHGHDDHGDDHNHDDHADGHGDDHDDHGHDDHEDDHADDHNGHDDHHVPYSALPPAEDLPGTHQETLESGNALFETTVLEPGSRFVDDDEWYLAVSPRSPYNRCVLPLMTLEATIDGETYSLTETIDDELHHHYGVPLEDDPDGADFELEVRTPPQVSRHQGFETAFVDMEPMSTVISL